MYIRERESFTQRINTRYRPPQMTHCVCDYCKCAKHTPNRYRADVFGVQKTCKRPINEDTKHSLAIVSLYPSQIFIYHDNILQNMFPKPIQLGTRKLQRGTSSFIINVPMLVINALEWEEKDDIILTLEPTGSVRMVKK